MTWPSFHTPHAPKLDTLKSCHYPGRNTNFHTQSSSTQILFGIRQAQIMQTETTLRCIPRTHSTARSPTSYTAHSLCRKCFIKQATSTRIILVLRKQNSREVPSPANGGDPLEYRSQSGALTSRPQCFIIAKAQLSCCCCCCTALSPSVKVLKAPKELSPSQRSDC